MNDNDGYREYSPQPNRPGHQTQAHNKEDQTRKHLDKQQDYYTDDYARPYEDPYYQEQNQNHRLAQHASHFRQQRGSPRYLFHVTLTLFAT